MEGSADGNAQVERYKHSAAASTLTDCTPVSAVLYPGMCAITRGLETCDSLMLGCAKMIGVR